MHFGDFKTKRPSARKKPQRKPLDTQSSAKPPRTDFHPKFWILLFFVLAWCEDKFNFRVGRCELNWYRSNESRQSFNYRSLNWNRSNESRQPFNNRSTIVHQLLTIVHWAETGQMRAGNRSTIVQRSCTELKQVALLQVKWKQAVVQLSCNFRANNRSGTRATFLI